MYCRLWLESDHKSAKFLPENPKDKSQTEVLCARQFTFQLIPQSYVCVFKLEFRNVNNLRSNKCIRCGKDTGQGRKGNSKKKLNGGFLCKDCSLIREINKYSKLTR